MPSILEAEFDHVMANLDEKRSHLVLALTVMTGQTPQAWTPWVFTTQTMPGHRSARIRAKDGGNGAQNTSGPPPADPRIPKQLAKDPYKLD